MTVTDTYRTFSSFQIKIENKFLSIVLNALKQQVNAFIAAGMHESKIDQIGVAGALIPIINNLYYQCGYGYGWSVYRSFSTIKSFSQLSTKGATTTITPADIAQEVVNTLRYSLLVNVHGIETTLKERILQIIQQGKDNGDGYEVTARNVEGVADIVRARRIVRTESVKGSNLAGMLGAKRTGLLMDKQWISARDSRVRGNPAGKYPNAEFDHWAVNGERVPIDGKYMGTGETMQYPGDPNGSAADIINCRCGQGFIPRRDSNGRLIRIAPGFFSSAGVLSIEKSNKIFIMKKEINSNQFPSMYASLGIDLSKLGCIMLDVDGSLVENVINKDDLYFSENPNRYWIKGFVAGHTPHVTLLYGLLKSGNTEYRPYVDEVLKGWNYDDVKIDHIDYFDSPYADDPYYCLIAHLEISKNLLDANQRLQLLPHINTYPTYKAHTTIAYIKKDEALRNELIGKYEEMLSGKKMKAIALNYGNIVS